MTPPPSISVAKYHELVKTHLGGVYPTVLPPPQQKTTERERRFPCPQPGCAYSGVTKACLNRHLGNVHDIGAGHHPCDQPGCTYVGKWPNHLRQHKQKAHDIDVKWHRCELCDFKTKTTVALRGHMANKHDIGVVWQHCQVPGCNYRCKQRRNLFQHAKWMHSGRTVLHASRVLKNMEPNVDARRREDAKRKRADSDDAESDEPVSSDLEPDSESDFEDEPKPKLRCMPCAPPAPPDAA